MKTQVNGKTALSDVLAAVLLGLLLLLIVLVHRMPGFEPYPPSVNPFFLMQPEEIREEIDYVDEKVEPRKNTLDVLVRFLGYTGWEEYQRNVSLPKEQQSSPVLSRRLSVANSLALGDRLRLTWQPERVCDIEYLGGLRFVVTASKNTRLHESDTFECSLIVEGEPLYLDNLIQDNHPPIAYVCGKKSGVNFEYIIPS